MNDLKKEDEIKRQYILETKTARETSVESNGKAVFYSGGGIGEGRRTKNHTRALEHAKKTGARPIDNTAAGLKLEGLYDRNSKIFLERKSFANFSRRVMKIASKRYAQEAKGEVKTFVCGARSSSVFRKTELPTLSSNKKVSSINGINRQAVAKAYEMAPDRAYRLVSLGELRQDFRKARLEAKRTGSDLALQDVRQRKGLYEKEFSKKMASANKTKLISKELERSAKKLGKETAKVQANKAKTVPKTQTRIVKVEPHSKLTRRKPKKGKGRGR